MVSKSPARHPTRHPTSSGDHTVCPPGVCPSGRRAQLAASLLVAALSCPGACTAEGDTVRPPQDQFVFPSGLALSPDESVLFVANANSELRYDSGSVVAVDLGVVDDAVDDWLASGEAPPACQPDPLVAGVLQCDESIAITGDRGVRIGNFATEIAVQTLDSGDLRLLVAVRGDPSVTWIDYSVQSGELSCEGGETVPLCDGPNRLVHLRGDTELPPLTAEPFGLFVDSTNGYALVTHLFLSTLTVVDLPTEGSAPLLADAFAGLFLPDPGTGIASAVGVAGRLPGSEGDLIYVTSRSEGRIRVINVERIADPADPGGKGVPALVPAEAFFLDGVQPSSDSRGIAFSADGSRAFIVNRSPAMLHILDTEMDERGVVKNQGIGFVELCDDPSNVATADVGRGDRVYVSCFGASQVWVIDPRSTSAPEAIIEVGRGPHEAVLSPGRQRLYVANFLEDTLSVVDLTPGAATENRVVLRLGVPRQSGEDE